MLRRERVDMRRLALTGLIALAACTALPTSTPAGGSPSAPPTIECGPLATDPPACTAAIQTALGPTTSAAASQMTFRVEAPNADATCVLAGLGCRLPTIIVNIYQASSGVLVGSVPLVRTSDGWVPISHIR
jgi:hypothetical protein